MDWRLLPPSPLKDLGCAPQDEEFVLGNGNNYKFRLPKHPKLQIFKWDGEHYGNPRIVDGQPDVGFDEIHLMVMTGSYGPYSTSHNVPGELSPVAAPGLPGRTVIVPEFPHQLDLDTKAFRVMGTGEGPVQDPRPAWEQPPKTLASPILMAGLPRGYDERYISFAAPLPPTPWTGVFMNLEPYEPPGSPPLAFVHFYRIPIADDDCSGGQCSHLYFNTQLLILDSAHSPLLVGNLQSEYR